MTGSSFEIVEISTTLPDQAAADQLAAAFIERRLAACVQISGPVTSLYRWQGKVEQSQEVSLKLKTSPGRRSEALDFLISQHPYDVPEVLIHQTTTTQAYADWVSDQTRAENE